MTLARLVNEYKPCLRADFRQYYGCSFDSVLKESVIEAADLAVMLPRGSRTMTQIDPAYSWTQETYLLANMANSLQLLVWINSKDGSKNRKRPKPIEPPKSKKQPKKQNAYTVDDYKMLLSLPRKGV